MKITEILLQKFWKKNEISRKALLNAMRIGLIKSSIDIEDGEEVIEKWARYVQFLYGQCLLKQAAREKGVLPFDHTMLKNKHQQKLLGNDYIIGLKQLIEPIVKCLCTEIKSIDENVAHILNLGEAEGNNQIVSDDSSIDGKEEKKEAKPGEFPGLLNLIKVLNFFNPELNNKKIKKTDQNKFCVFYNNNYEIIPTEIRYDFASHPETYMFRNSTVIKIVTDHDDESLSNNSDEEGEEGEEEDSVEKILRSDSTVSSIKPTPNKRMLSRKLTPSKHLIEDTEISSDNSRAPKSINKNRNSRYFSEHTSTIASQKSNKSTSKPGKKINCGNYFSELTELSISQNIPYDVDDRTEDGFSTLRNGNTIFFEDDDNGKNKLSVRDDLSSIDLSNEESEEKIFENTKKPQSKFEIEKMEGFDSIESEDDSDEVRIDIEKVPLKVPRLPLIGTNLKKFDGIYSVRGSFHIASNMPNIGHELAGYFVPMTVIEAEQLEKATVPRWQGFNFQFIQNHPRLVGFIGAGLLLVAYSAVAGTQPWEASIDSLASTIATDVFGQLGSDVVEQATEIIKDILMTFYNLIAGASLAGALVIWSFLVNYLSRLPTIQHGKLSTTENEDVNHNNKKKKSNCWGKKKQPFEEELLVPSNFNSKEQSYGSVVKFSNEADKSGCSLAWVEWRGRNYLIRLWDNFLLTSNNQEALLKKPLEKISKQYETLSKKNEKLTKQLDSQKSLLEKQGQALKKLILERSEMSKPLNSINGKDFNDVDLSEITLPNDPVRKNTLRNPSMRRSKKIDSDEDYTSDITIDTEMLKNNMQSFKELVIELPEKDLLSGKTDLPESVKAVVIAIGNVEAVLEKHAVKPKKYNKNLLQAAQQLSEALEKLSDKKREESVKSINIVSIEEIKEDKKDDDSLIFEIPKENPMKQLQLLVPQLSESVQEMINQIKKQSRPTLKTVKDDKFTAFRKQRSLRTPQSFGSKVNFFEKKANNKSSDDGDSSLSEASSNKNKSEKFSTHKESHKRRVTSGIFKRPKSNNKQKIVPKIEISKSDKSESSGSDKRYNSGSSSD